MRNSARWQGSAPAGRAKGYTTPQYHCAQVTPPRGSAPARIGGGGRSGRGNAVTGLVTARLLAGAPPGRPPVAGRLLWVVLLRPLLAALGG